MAMAETVETTPWINRWPDQLIKPPSRPVVTAVAADAAVVNPTGMVAGIIMLVLSLATFQVLFGGTNLRTRLMFRRGGGPVGTRPRRAAWFERDEQ
jgi:hypothetical protein